MTPKVLEEEIVKKREEYQAALQPFYRRCKRNEVGGFTFAHLVANLFLLLKHSRLCIQPYIYIIFFSVQVKLEVKLAAGFSPKIITIEEAQNTNTRWIVLDR